MALSSMLVIPLYALFKTLCAPGDSLMEKLRHVTTPTPEIQARLEEIRAACAAGAGTAHNGPAIVNDNTDYSSKKAETAA